MHWHLRQNTTFTGLSGGYEALFAAPHRFSFNGKENDSEVKGEGNSLDFGARLYDSRLGRWMRVDPLSDRYVALSPYNFVANCPMSFIDPDGEKIVDANGKEVKVTIIKNDDGTIKSISYEFLPGTKEDVKTEFKNNAEIIFSKLGQTKSGVEQLEKAISIDTKISFKLDHGKSTEDKSKNDGRAEKPHLGWTWNPYTEDSKGKRTIDKSRITEVTIYLGTIMELHNKPGTEEAQFSVDEIIGYTAGHEIEHTTDKNRMINIDKHNMPGTFQQNIEKKPEEVESKIKTEYKSKKNEHERK